MKQLASNGAVQGTLFRMVRLASRIKVLSPHRYEILTVKRAAHHFLLLVGVFSAFAAVTAVSFATFTVRFFTLLALHAAFTPATGVLASVGLLGFFVPFGCAVSAGDYATWLGLAKSESLLDHLSREHWVSNAGIVVLGFASAASMTILSVLDSTRFFPASVMLPVCAVSIVLLSRETRHFRTLRWVCLARQRREMAIFFSRI